MVGLVEPSPSEPGLPGQRSKIHTVGVQVGLGCPAQTSIIGTRVDGPGANGLKDEYALLHMILISDRGIHAISVPLSWVERRPSKSSTDVRHFACTVLGPN